ncbi:MAG: glycosyltransferase family 4 protein [Cyclobacteriaceae bacterium]|nr:glycosyltransferase family 4 protein [Cyclobacteriaceae bacterium]
MQIIHIVPGSGGSFYCGNCLRDSEYLQGIRQAGAEVIKVPMYLPIFADEHDLEKDIPVFYGAISLYLKHAVPVFRKAPAWVDRILNSGPALKLAAHMAGSTNPKGLEDMTISMLLGEQGQEKEELDKMIDWIAEHCSPDVIHISNALLLGLAKKIKEKLDVIVVCTLQDEDVWVDAMDDDFRRKTWELMKERAEDVDAFFAVSDYYAHKMRPLLGIPDEKLYTQHITIAPEGYTPIPDRPLNIGYMSRMCEANGLEILINAFILLKKDPKWEQVKLVVTGGSTSDDNPFIKKMKKKVDQAGLHEHVDFHKHFEDEDHHDFFKQVSVLSVPVLEGEAFGLYLLEAMASGVAVVQPALGAFPEIIEKSGGGVTYQPNSPEPLAQALADLLSHPEKLAGLSKAGAEGVRQKFNIHQQATEIIALYKKIQGQNKKETHAA